jgi:hypothetical protein
VRNGGGGGGGGGGGDGGDGGSQMQTEKMTPLSRPHLSEIENGKEMTESDLFERSKVVFHNFAQSRIFGTLFSLVLSLSLRFVLPYCAPRE